MYVAILVSLFKLKIAGPVGKMYSYQLSSRSGPDKETSLNEDKYFFLDIDERVSNYASDKSDQYHEKRHM